MQWLNTDNCSEAEFKEFESWFKFKPRLNYGWFSLKIVSNVSRFKPALNLNRVLARLKFFKFGLRLNCCNTGSPKKTYLSDLTFYLNNIEYMEYIMDYMDYNIADI